MRPVRRRNVAATTTTTGGSDADALRDACDELGLALDAQGLRKLVDYCTLLRKWNAVYNLTAIRDPGAMLVQHLFDCLAVLPPLAAEGLRDGAVVLDVGSGAGLPGVVIAVAAPAVEVHCVDAVGKKAAFVRQVRAELGLPNLHAHHARVEDLCAPRDLPAATLVVSRAFSSLADFVSLTAHLLAPGGRWAAMKGALPDDELSALPPGVRLARAITLRVPRLDAQRHLLVLERGA
jgi:16S rRNA (guanine527-N7)-methyltransferase